MNTHRTFAVPLSTQPKRRRQEARAPEPIWHSPCRLNEGKGNHKPSGGMMGTKVGVTRIPPSLLLLLDHPADGLPSQAPISLSLKEGKVPSHPTEKDVGTGWTTEG